jgi:hypothetical protein
VTVKATGKVPTPGHRAALVPSFIDIFPPQYRLVVTPPTGIVTQVQTPFKVEAAFIAAEVINTVTIHDSAGPHVLNVDQAQD